MAATSPRRFGALALLLSLLCLAAPEALSEVRAAEERWYALRLRGEPVGWLRDAVREEDGRIASEESLRLSLLRGGETLLIELSGRFVETPDGTPLDAESTQRVGAGEVVRRTRFEGAEVEVTVLEGGRRTTARRPAPEGPWLAPAARERFVRAEIARGAREVRFRTVDFTGDPAPLDTVMRRAGEEILEVGGKVVPALAWDVELSLLPGVTVREYTDGQGRSLSQTLELLPGVPLTAEIADRDLATAPVRPVELLAATLVSPEGRFAAPRRLRRAVYSVRSTDPSWAGPAPTGVQRVAPEGRGCWRVTVDLEAPQAGGEPPGEEFRRPSTYVGSDDPAVERLAAEALVGAGPSDAEAAEALRRFVRRFVRTKDLSVGLATASEVARTRQGDCTEHAVLLAALLRARGIPSRMASGLVYLDRFLGRDAVFGYHMWTQAWLAQGAGPGRWVDLDAALDDAPFDAAHLALTTSALADGAFTNDLVRLAPVLGRLAIRIVEPGGSAPSVP